MGSQGISRHLESCLGGHSLAFSCEGSLHEIPQRDGKIDFGTENNKNDNASRLWSLSRLEPGCSHTRSRVFARAPPQRRVWTIDILDAYAAQHPPLLRSDLDMSSGVMKSIGWTRSLQVEWTL